MKKVITILFATILLIFDNTYVLECASQPQIIISEEAKNISQNIIEQLVQANPSAKQITILEYGELSYSQNDIEPYLIRAYSEVDKQYTSKNVLADDIFVISVAKGEELKLEKKWKHTLESSITGNIDAQSLGITANVTVEYGITQTFKGPEESSNYNSREFRVSFFKNIGTYTALAHDDLAGFIVKVPISGDFEEASHYVSYSIDSVQ